ncbi:hypothetical protein O9929_24920 [Vibrio lentus]|nr:hypothetical protein [Vibrio lentus]
MAEQNGQVAAGRIGAAPYNDAQEVQFNLVTKRPTSKRLMSLKMLLLHCKSARRFNGLLKDIALSLVKSSTMVMVNTVVKMLRS